MRKTMIVAMVITIEITDRQSKTQVLKEKLNRNIGVGNKK